MSDSCTIDDVGPMPIARPGSVAELGDLVRRAAGEGQALYPLGGRTTLHFGLPPARVGLGVDLRGLTQVIDYPARDMTITVQAGITLGKLQELLRTENQRLPIDVPCCGEATLGGALAANVSGPRRYGWGTLRDYVIGIHVVNDEGHDTKAGGRVVKNVAGYDLCKLHVGALGTLGIISAVTLKVRPRAEACGVVCIPCAVDDLVPVLELVHRSQTRPICVEVLNPPAAAALQLRAASPWAVLVGFEQNEPAVAWQMAEFSRRELPGELQKQAHSWMGEQAEGILGELGEYPHQPNATLAFKANLLPHGVAAFCRKASGLSNRLRLQAHAGNGIILGHIEGELSLEEAQSILAKLREEAIAAAGNLVVRRCPTAWKKSLPIWGTPRGDLPLMKAVKKRLDPKQLFNPGRMFSIE
jgi:glycolate oxidase FAD binding subunit